MIKNVNFILIPHPIPELANHPVPLIGVLLLAAVVAIVDPLEGEVELEVVGDCRDEVDGVPDQNLVLYMSSSSLITHPSNASLPTNFFADSASTA